MSTSSPAGERDTRSPEQRAEDLMQRVAADVTRFVTRFAGRTREEFEDIVAEARDVKARWDSPEDR